MQRMDIETASVVSMIVCDRCDRRTTRNETEFHEMTSISLKAGYGSIFGVGNHVEVDLCQHCLREALGAWLRVRDKETEAERATDRLVKLVQTMVEESGNPAGFDAAQWTASFLKRPMPALGGKAPSEFMGTEEGQALIETLISRMQSGTYS